MNATLCAIQILAENLLEGLWGIGFFLVLIVVSVLTQAVKKMKEEKERQERMRRGDDLDPDHQAQQPPRPQPRQDPRLAEQIRRTMSLPAEPPVRPEPARSRPPAPNAQHPTPPPARAPQKAPRRKPPAQLKIKPRRRSARAQAAAQDEGVLPDTPLHRARRGRKNAVKLGLDDPDTLRRALIYHEVFSKPVGLRNPGQHPQ